MLPRRSGARYVDRMAQSSSTSSNRSKDIGDSVRFARFEGLSGLEIMSARWVEHSFAPHSHDFYAVSLNRGGYGAFHCRRELHDAAPGTCNLIGPGELHTGQPVDDRGWSYHNLYIESTLMTALLESLDAAAPAVLTFRAPLVRDPVLAAQLRHLFTSLRSPLSLLHVETALMSIIRRVAAEHIECARSLPVATARREPRAVYRVKEWLDVHAEENVSIRALAELVGLSPHYLVREFHRHVGVPPHRYQKLVRVNRARRLLAAGVPISQAAYQAGFYDQSHLNRCFKETMGVTPGHYVAA